MFDDYYLPHELLLTTRQKTKLRNAFNDNMIESFLKLKFLTLFNQEDF